MAAHDSITVLYGNRITQQKRIIFTNHSSDLSV